MSTSQVLNSGLHSNGTPPVADGLKAGMMLASAGQSDSGPASPPPQANAERKQVGLTEKVRRDATVLRNALAFTQVVGLLMRSPHYRQYTIADLEWLVIPPVLAGQFRIGEAQTGGGQGNAVPVAVVLWAFVSPELDKRLREENSPSFQLKPEEWKSGDIPWLVHAAGETRFVRFVVDQLAKTTFKGRPFKVRGRDREGNVKVHVLNDPAKEPSASSDGAQTR